MKRKLFLSSLSFLFLFFISSWTYCANQAMLLEITDPIGPATQDYVQRNLKIAQKNPQISFIILSLDTSGGIDTSIRAINTAILSSSIPVVAYVAPKGARVANLATFIIYASHIAAMTPDSNIGATNPLEKNSSTDAIAYLRNLAQLRDRNSEWPEKALEGNVNLSAEDALKFKVIDLVAENIPDLLQKLNGRTVKVQGSPLLLKTNDIEVKTIKPGYRFTLLTFLTDPTTAYLLLLIAIYGLFLEFYHPGFIFPGAIGGICLLLTLYGFEFLPINYGALTLLLSGIVCMIIEASLARFGVFTVVGIAAFAIGSYFFLHASDGHNHIPWVLIPATSIITAAFFYVVIGIYRRTKGKKTKSLGEKH